MEHVLQSLKMSLSHRIVSIIPSLSMKNQSYSQSTRPSFLANWSTPLPYWLVPQHHICLLDSVESKALNIIGNSHDEAEAQDLFLRHLRQVSGLCVFFTASPLVWLTLLSSPPTLTS